MTESGGSLGRDVWRPETLHQTVMALRKELPKSSTEGIFRAVDASARLLPPTAGQLRLLHKARELLRQKR